MIYVRDKILIALAAVEGQEVEEKVPVVILAKNEWFKRHEAAGLAERAVLKSGVFKKLYDKVCAGKEIAEEEAYMSGEVTHGVGRDAKVFTAHMFVLRPAT